MAEVKEKIKVKILRFNPTSDKESYYKEYDVPFGKGLTVLMVLNHIYENIDKSIAYYYSCRTGKCGGCTLMINGKAVQSCVAPVDGNIVVEPMRGFEVIKDLVVDVDKPLKGGKQ